MKTKAKNIETQMEERSGETKPNGIFSFVVRHVNRYVKRIFTSHASHCMQFKIESVSHFIFWLHMRIHIKKVFNLALLLHIHTFFWVIHKMQQLNTFAQMYSPFMRDGSIKFFGGSSLFFERFEIHFAFSF